MSTPKFLSSIPPSLKPLVTLPLLTLAFYIIPLTIHKTVQSVDTLYDLLDRRARSPYEAPISFASMLIAGGLIMGWHVCLAVLGYVAVDDEDGQGERGKRKGSGEGVGWNWDRILGKVVIPFGLLVLGIQFGWEIIGKFMEPGDLAVGNKL